LAFKGKTTEEIYDVLMMQLVRAIQKYDPSYTDKVRVVAEKIEDAFQKQFTILELNGRLDFDGNRYVRLLCRRGFLEAVKGGKDKRIIGFLRSATWPPPASFFKSGAIGLAYYLQTWFGCDAGQSYAEPPADAVKRSKSFAAA